MNNPVKALVVDDSKLIRRVLCRVFEESESVKVVGEAGNGKEALEMVHSLNPDVITLDVNMPVMDGLTALKHIMIKYPRPTVMVSSLTREGAAVTFDALKYGAIDFIHKPSKVKGKNLEEQYRDMIKKVTLAAEVEIDSIRLIRSKKSKPAQNIGRQECKYVFAVGAAEGGYGSLLKIIPYLRQELPVAFIIVIHAGTRYVDAFARYLDVNSMFNVKRAVDGDAVEAGTCYIAAGTEFISLDSARDGNILHIVTSGCQNCKGAVNFLMASLARILKKRSIGLILTGSGNDGINGMQAINRAGGGTIVQKPETCLCREMPESIMDKCNVNMVIADNKLADKLNRSFCAAA